MVTPYVMVSSSTDHQRVGIPEGSLTGRSAHPAADARGGLMGFLTDPERAIVAAAADRLVPPGRRPPGRRRARRRRLHRRAARRVRGRSAPHLGRRTVLRPGRRRRGVRALPGTLAARDARVAHAHRGFARNSRARTVGTGHRVAGALPRRHRRARRRLRRPSGPTSRTPASTRSRDFRGPPLRARRRGRLRRARVPRQPRPRRLDRDRVPRRRPAARLHRRGSGRPCVSDADREWDAVVIGTGPAGATAAEVLTAAGWSVLMLEKGRNHLLDLEAPFGPLGHVSNDELKFMRRHFLGPDPWLEPRTFRRGEDDGDRLEIGDVNNLPSTVGGGGFHADGKLPRFREDDFKPVSAAGPVEGAALVDWPVDYDEMEPYYAAAERTVGVAGEAGANPFASWRADPYPMPPGADMYCAVVTAEAATRARLPPVPRADRRQQRRVRRPARVQQLRVLRLLRLPDRRQGRPGRAAAPRAAHRQLRDPHRVDRHRRAARRLRPPGAGRPLPRRRARRARGLGPPRGARRRRVRDAAPAAAHRARATPTSSATTSSSTSRPTCSACSPSGCTATGAGRSPTSWTTRSCPTSSHGPRPATPGCRSSGAGSSSTARPGTRSSRASISPTASCTPSSCCSR